MTQASELVDITMLNELKQLMEDDFSLLVETFLVDSIERIDALKQAVAAKDTDQIRQAAHSFKGSCSNLGASSLAKLLKQLELSARDGSIDDVEQCFKKVPPLYAQVAEYFKALIAQ